jgi:hypothetical protein
VLKAGHDIFADSSSTLLLQGPVEVIRANIFELPQSAMKEHSVSIRKRLL